MLPLIPSQPDPTYPLFPVFSFLGIVLGLLPLSWHLQAWNAGTCIYMLWASLASFVEFVDSIIWYGSLADVAPVWCDVSTKFLIGAGVGIPASSLCIARRLYIITSVNTVSVSRKEKLKSAYIDIAIAIGIPVIVMALHYIVQGHRYNIVENIGCTPDIWNTVLAYPLVFMWPVLLGGITFVYASLTLRTFYIHRVRFNQIMSSNTSLTVSRYLRLIMLCCVEMALVTPLSAFSIYINTAGLHIQPWVSWANTHYNFSFVELFPTFAWQAKLASHIAIEMGRWIYPCSSIIFFLLFGFADEARRCYVAAFWRVAKVFSILPKPEKGRVQGFGFMRPFPTPASFSSDVLPSYSPPAPSHRKRADSFTSSFKHDLENRARLESKPYVPPPASPTDSGLGCRSYDVKFSSESFEALYSGLPSEHDDVPEVQINVSDELPPSFPPTPVVSLQPIPTAVLPPSPPTRPEVSTLIPRKCSAGSISIMVHTESRTF